MLLPGGLWEDGQTQRDFGFVPPDGSVELAVAEPGPGSVPARVTAALSACLSRLGNVPVTPDRIAALCVADRQFLMRRLAALLGRDRLWRSTRCGACGALFDIPVDQSRLPVSEPGPTYPFTKARLDGTEYRLRVPTGADQEVVATVADSARARQLLAWRCMLDEGKPAPEDLDEPALEAIETALEAITPEAAVEVETACPECDHPQRVYIDPYTILETTAGELYDEIHILATTYHWDETTILALPRARRRRYLDLIDRARGMTT